LRVRAAVRPLSAHDAQDRSRMSRSGNTPLQFSVGVAARHQLAGDRVALLK